MTKLQEIAEYEDFFIDYHASLPEAITKMNKNANGSVVLLNENFPVAMLTQSDIINALGEKADLSLSIYHYATQVLISVEETRPIEFAIKLFSEHNIRRIVLLDEKKEFAGVVLQERLFDFMGEDISKVEVQQEVDKQLEKRLENEYLLMQQSKLATMGEMIGHIAHQWRQPLAQLGGIFMNLDAAYAHKDLTPEYLEKRINKGNELIKYMSQTIDDFRHFFEPNETEQAFNVEDYIQSAVHIIEASLTYSHIELKVISPKEPLFVQGYASEFSQVILNLLDNAKDILIEREIKQPKIVIETLLINNKVVITVQDNAGGIDEKIIGQIFDIYFSTKRAKGGSGLGLYMSKLIIERKSMGTLDVSNTNEGASFSISLNLD
ncbi:MAG: Multi-sensor signal transduction histidine kinase [uncultured Sulfurovum sp.]|uniref:histidine kinase n=1 Tax=uncultured Sulfurovum sp. TaxID=269237 RepID=A0A6S6TDH8_9BACT|nr:MAG: Multi-sensor signal transduction histidine kinase [uncultured Sulfurovum sp.]